jgi:hypothetical protein
MCLCVLGVWRLWALLQEDWRKDSRGTDRVVYVDFHASMFELLGACLCACLLAVSLPLPTACMRVVFWRGVPPSHTHTHSHKLTHILHVFLSPARRHYLLFAWNGAPIARRAPPFPLPTHTTITLPPTHSPTTDNWTDSIDVDDYVSLAVDVEEAAARARQRVPRRRRVRPAPPAPPAPEVPPPPEEDPQPPKSRVPSASPSDAEMKLKAAAEAEAAAAQAAAVAAAEAAAVAAAAAAKREADAAAARAAAAVSPGAGAGARSGRAEGACG